jgi:hypothetical protein
MKPEKELQNLNHTRYEKQATKEKGGGGRTFGTEIPDLSQNFLEPEL